MGSRRRRDPCERRGRARFPAAALRGPPRSPRARAASYSAGSTALVPRESPRISMSRLLPLLALSAALGSPLAPALALDASRARRPDGRQSRAARCRRAGCGSGRRAGHRPGSRRRAGPARSHHRPAGERHLYEPDGEPPGRAGAGGLSRGAQDLTRAQSARYFTARGDSNKGEYGTLLNMVAQAGFPAACARQRFYPRGGACLNDGGKMYGQGAVRR